MSGQPSRDAPTDSVEIEWQFDAIDLRPVERWLANLPGPSANAPHHLTAEATDLPPEPPTVLARPARRLVDHYLDTSDWRIARAGFVLRTRSRGRQNEVTLKDTRPAGAGGLRQRLEVSEPLPDAGLDALEREGPVGRRLAAVAGRGAFRQMLEIRTRRRPYVLRVGEEEVAEVALDDTVITAGPDQHPARLRRVEVEVVPAWVDKLEPLVVDLRLSCGLQPATLSKFEAGLLALGIQVPGPPDLGSTEVSPTSTLSDLAYAVVRTHLGVLLAREPGTRLGEDIEELHDMRVATRRLRAATELFAEALPARAQAMRTELAWVAGVLGRVRDLDVQLERLGEMEQWALGGDDDQSPLDELRQLLVHHRDEARRDLIDALDSPRWERLTEDLVTMAQQGQRRRLPSARTQAAASVPDLVTPRHQAVVKAARRARRSGMAADFHRLRKRCKRLRYSLEFTAGIYGAHTERFTKKLAKLQDALGLMQDAEVATTRLLALATGEEGGSPDRSLPARTVFAMGAVAERYRAESAALLAKMGKRLGVLRGDEWHDLAVLMARRQAAAVAAQPSPVPPSSALSVESTVSGGIMPAVEPEERGLPVGSTGDRRAMPLAVAVASWPDPYWGAPQVTEPNGSPRSAASAGGGLDASPAGGDHGPPPITGGDLSNASDANGDAEGVLDTGEAGGSPEMD
jgi:CHAD domain-containing protein